MDLVSAGASKSQTRDFIPKLTDAYSHVLHQGVLDHSGPALIHWLRTVAENVPNDDASLSFRATCQLLADLVEQGWELSIVDLGFRLQPPSSGPTETESVQDVKNRQRRNLVLFRNRQLAEPSVRRFLLDMERPRTFGGKQVSVLDLIDDGKNLADELSRVSRLSLDNRQVALGQVIRPVVQICDDKSRCEHTGLLLRDIWRYFRHTWSLEYRPTPSRKFQVLVRNAARPMAPVMGIAMLTNAPTNLAERDKWIGWSVDEVCQTLRDGNGSADALMITLLHSLDRAIEMVRADDLVTLEELNEPQLTTVERLISVAQEASAKRLQNLQELEELGTGIVRTRELPTTPGGEVDWRLASEAPLFVKKRAGTLATLLRAKLAFQKSGVWREPAAGSRSLIRTAEGRKAIAAALQEVRKVALASSVMDVSVCGAIPPYGELLGGKLVAMVLGSTEIDQAYRDRYGHQVSVIASQMKGSPVTRSADLLLLTTTSLYGVGSSQYNRLILRRGDHPELGYDLAWKELGISKGFGSAHLSKATVTALRDLSRRRYGARRVNNLFGEGTSPRLRQIREGLEALGLKSDSLLEHANPRILYAMELSPGARRRLMGLESELPLPQKPSVQTIGYSWLSRWVVRRVENQEVIARIGMIKAKNIQEQLGTVSESRQPDA